MTAESGYLCMDAIMSSSPSSTDQILARAQHGQSDAVADLFAKYRDRLAHMIRLRLDRRLQGRLDPEDVLQDVFLIFAKRLRQYRAEPSLPFYLWLRNLAGQKLIDLHRAHLGAQMRNAGIEISIYRHALPQVSSISLAQQLLGNLTSPTQAAVLAELQLRLQEVLNAMDPMDREVLVLRHFEELSNEETAQSLGIQKSAASKRYIRALERLRVNMAGIPGFF